MSKVVVPALLIVVGALLAFSGHIDLLARSGMTGAPAWLESFLRSMQMITSPFSGSPLPLDQVKDTPPQIQAARILIPAGILSGTALVLLKAFGRQMRAFRARFASNHVVVCGLGDPARHIVADLRARGQRRIVAIDLDPDPAGAEHYHRARVPVLRSKDRVDDAVLRRAALARAKAVIALSRNDLANLETMLAAQRIAAKARPADLHPLIARANVVEPDVHEAAGFLLGAEAGALAYRPVSVARNAVRQLVLRHPLDLDPEVRHGGRVHVLVLGFGRVGQELALEVARSAHYADLHVPWISILDREATTRLDAFLRRHPGLSHAAELRAVDMDVREGRMGDDPRLEALIAGHRPSRAVICFSGGSLGLATAARMHEPLMRRRLSELPVFVRLSDAPEVAQAFRDARRVASATNIVVFGDTAALFTEDIVLEESLDVLARAVHENYLDEMRALGADMTRPATQPWERLPESFREASRCQADHIAPKLRAIGCEAVPGAAEPFAFTAGEIELLARMEHVRWCAERWVSGWRHAPARNDAMREHSSLVPWDALSESEREKDREAVRSIPKILARIGHSVRRAEPAC